MKKATKIPKEDPNNTWNMQFMAATKAGNYDEMRSLQDKGAEVDHVVIEGDGEDQRINTPFTQRLRQSDIDTMRHLLDKYHANVNQKIENGQTGLHYAVEHEMSDVIDVLLEYPEIDTKLKDNHDDTPTQLAINKGKVDIAAQLLKGGAYHDFRQRGTGDHTQTQLACMQGELGLLETLLELGESVYQRDMQGNSLLHLAATNERRPVVELLLSKHANIDAKNNLGITPLWACLTTGKWDEASFLVSRGASLNASNTSGIPLLHSAIQLGAHEMVMKALEFGADPTTRDCNGNTSLHWAACGNSARLVDLLCEAKAPQQDRSAPVVQLDINSTNKEGSTALHKACYWGTLPVVQYLLQKGADSNIQNLEGQTALHMCVARGYIDVATELLVHDPGNTSKPQQETKKKPAKGKPKKDEKEEEETAVKQTDPNIEDFHNMSPLQVSMGLRNTAMSELLISHGGNVQKECPIHGTLLHQGVKHGNLELVVALITGGANVKQTDGHSNTALHIAASIGALDILKYLMERGADKDAQNDTLHTCTHVAVQQGHYSVVHHLVIEARANIFLRDQKEQTPLHIASQVGASNIANLLLDHCDTILSNNINGNFNTATPQPPLPGVGNNGCTLNPGNMNPHPTPQQQQGRRASNLSNSGRQTSALPCEDVELAATYGNAVEINGRTALHIACDFMNPDVVQVLISHGVNIESRDNGGWSPLHAAVHAGCERSTSLLVEAAAELNTPNNSHNTPIMLASQAGKVQCARILVINERKKRLDAV